MKAKKTLGMGMQDLLRLTLRDEMSAADKLLAEKKRQIARLEEESRRLKPAKPRRAAAATPAEAGHGRGLGAESEPRQDRPGPLPAGAHERLPEAEATRLYQQAVAALKEGRSADALRGLSVLLHFQPDHVKAWNNLGVAFYELGLIADADAAFRRVLAIDPGHAAARENLLAIEAGQAGRGGD